MVKKNSKKDTKVSVDVELDELVNEGKKIDIAKVEEVIKENKDTAEDHVANVTENETDDATNTDVNVNNDTVTVVTEEGKQTDDNFVKDDVHISESIITEEEDNIDDVIAECTGEYELKESTEELKKNSEPWYVARAKRLGDYYNW